MIIIVFRFLFLTFTGIQQFIWVELSHRGNKRNIEVRGRKCRKIVRPQITCLGVGPRITRSYDWTKSLNYVVLSLKGRSQREYDFT